MRFTLPDPVLALPERERTAGAWMSHASPSDSVMMQIPDVGAFVRALLPVHLSDGDSVTFGVWVAIDPRDDRLRSIAELWWDDNRYGQLRLDGWLGNELPPWTGLLAAPVVAEVRDVKETPYCVSSTNDLLSRILTEKWEPGPVLDALA